ncbi:sialin-like [Oppia nitens]|uniref:sialin-like n=1 Tax=Oppia nitens TaxID=1686743 RepID=UPI0023DA10C8|nr:sialin-like [Oppia nitens]
MSKLRNDSLVSGKKSVNNSSKHGLGCIPVRYLIVLLSVIANGLSYTMRTNLNLTIVAMVKRNDGTHDYDTCPVGDGSGSQTNSKEEIEGDFEWSESIQGVVLGAYYYGYIVTNCFGGQLADWMGARLLVGASLLSSGILTLIIPVCANWSVYSVIVVRIATGLAQGVLTPSLYTMLAYWIPLQERGLTLALIQVGGNIGAVITSPLSAALSQQEVFADGWPAVFYVLGILGCVCFFPWFYVIHNTPQEHPRISDDELMYIQAHVTASSRRKRGRSYVPWGSILKSRQVWIILITKFCAAWGNLFLMSKLPAYLESVLHLSMDLNGVVNACIYIALSVSLMFFGYISDLIERRRLMNRTVSRKLFETLGLSGAAVLMAVIPAVGCNQGAVITLLIFGMIVLGLMAGGDSPIVVDVAPDYSGSLYGLTNSFASFPGFLAPLVVGLVLDGNTSSNPMSQWNILFYLAAGIYLVGAISFCLFISAKPQSWGRARHGTIRATIDETTLNGSVYIKSRHNTVVEADNDDDNYSNNSSNDNNNENSNQSTGDNVVQNI